MTTGIYLFIYFTASAPSLRKLSWKRKYYKSWKIIIRVAKQHNSKYYTS